jgi:hypothetical protein
MSQTQTAGPMRLKLKYGFRGFFMICVRLESRSET